MEIILVRHAHTGSPLPGSADLGRHLSDVGQEAGDRLAAELLAHLPARIISSPYLRCIETIQPLASKLDRIVEVDERLGQEASDREVQDFANLLLSQSDSVVVASHGPTIRRLALAILDPQGIVLDGEAISLVKASALIFEIDGETYPRMVSSASRMGYPGYEKTRLFG